MSYKTGAEKLAKERRERLDDAALKRAKAAPKSKKKVSLLRAAELGRKRVKRPAVSVTSG